MERYKWTNSPFTLNIEINLKITKTKTMKAQKTAKADYKSSLKGLKWLGQNAKNSFHYLAGINRPIYPAQVTKLAESLDKMGVVRPIIVAEIDFITGRKIKYIIDGQHLFNALIRLGYDIPYVAIQIKDKRDLVETIAMLNASSKTWSLLDYITAWGSLIPDYVKLNHYFQVYDIDMGIVSSILSGISTDGGNVSKRIKRGEFRVINEEENVEILDRLTDVLKVVPRMNRIENRYLCREYVKFLRTTKKYNHEKFIEKLAKSKDKFILATQEEGKLMELFSKICVN